MKRLVLAAVVVGLLVAGCAGGDPRPTTYISDTGATLNANVYTTFGGQVEYWWRYGTEDTYGSETPHRTIEIEGEDPYPATALPHAVSQPVAGLAADTTYHHQFCARDQQEDPPRTVCNTDRTFTTKPAGGTSGIAFTRDVGFFDSDVFTMDADGTTRPT